MEVNCFQILLIDVVTFYLKHVQTMVLNVLIKNENPDICGTGGLRVKSLSEGTDLWNTFHANPSNIQKAYNISSWVLGHRCEG